MPPAFSASACHAFGMLSSKSSHDVGSSMAKPPTGSNASWGRSLPLFFLAPPRSDCAWRSPFPERPHFGFPALVVIAHNWRPRRWPNSCRLLPRPGQPMPRTKQRVNRTPTHPRASGPSYHAVFRGFCLPTLTCPLCRNFQRCGKLRTQCFSHHPNSKTTSNPTTHG